MRLNAPAVDGVQVNKIYRFRRGSYLIDVGFEIVNQGAAAVQPYAYFQIVRDGKPPAGDSAMMPTFTGVAVYTDKEKFQKLTFRGDRQGEDALSEEQQRWLDRGAPALLLQRVVAEERDAARILYAQAR